MRMNIAGTNGPDRWLVKVGEGRSAVGIIVDWSATDAGVWSMPFHCAQAHGYWEKAGETDQATRERIEALAAKAPPVPDNIYG